MKYTRFVRVNKAGQRTPPVAVGYKLWNEKTQLWDSCNAAGEVTEKKGKEKP